MARRRSSRNNCGALSWFRTGCRSPRIATLTLARRLVPYHLSLPSASRPASISRMSRFPDRWPCTHLPPLPIPTLPLFCAHVHAGALARCPRRVDVRAIEWRARLGTQRRARRVQVRLDRLGRLRCRGGRAPSCARDVAARPPVSSECHPWRMVLRTDGPPAHSLSRRLCLRRAAARARSSRAHRIVCYRARPPFAPVPSFAHVLGPQRLTRSNDPPAVVA